MVYICTTRYNHSTVTCGVAHNSIGSAHAHAEQLNAAALHNAIVAMGAVAPMGWLTSAEKSTRDEAYALGVPMSLLGKVAYPVSNGKSLKDAVRGGIQGMPPHAEDGDYVRALGLMSKTGPMPQPDPVPRPDPMPQPDPTPQPSGDISAALGALQSLLVDKTALQAMVDEAVSAKVPRRIEVKVGDSPAKPVKGRSHAALEKVLSLAALRQNILLVGPAGSGKTTLSSQVAEAFDLPLWTISLSGGTTESHLKGRYVPTGESGRFEYVPSPFVGIYEGGGVILLDELDAADENVLVSLHTALDNGYLDLPDRVNSPVAKRHEDTIILASANTYGAGANRQYCGRNALDGATLDRFTAGLVEMDYDRSLEEALTTTKALRDRLWRLRDAVSKAGIRRLVSTRTMVALDRQMAAGILADTDAAVKQLTLGWSEDELRSAGVSL